MFVVCVMVESVCWMMDGIAALATIEPWSMDRPSVVLCHLDGSVGLRVYDLMLSVKSGGIVMTAFRFPCFRSDWAAAGSV